jgi:hypothetical protein
MDLGSSLNNWQTFLKIWVSILIFQPPHTRLCCQTKGGFPPLKTCGIMLMTALFRRWSRKSAKRFLIGDSPTTKERLTLPGIF